MKTQKPCPDCEARDCEQHKEQPQHTPTPWKFTHHINIGGDQMARIDDADGMFIAGVSDKNLIDHTRRDVDAAFIVRAVNSHEELLEALKLANLQLMELGMTNTGWPDLSKVWAAIARAEGK